MAIEGWGGSICVGRGWGKRKKDTKNVREEEKHKEWERQRGLYVVMELIIRYHDDNILYTKRWGSRKEIKKNGKTWHGKHNIQT